MIIGITGTIGAGKGTVVDYLLKTKGFTHYSVRNLLIEEIEKQGKTFDDRGALRDMANELRRTYGPSYVIETLHARAKEDGGNALIESVRAIAEGEFLKQQGAYILAVDADRKARYQRIVERGFETDHVDFETWVTEEERELASTEPWDMNVIGVMQMADYRIENDGTLEELHQKVEEMLATLSK
jgi:dephospho-CoA kinase